MYRNASDFSVLIFYFPTLLNKIIISNRLFLWGAFRVFQHTEQRRQWQTTPVLLPGKSHGQRSHGVAKNSALLSNFTFTVHFHALEKEMATYSSILAWRIPGMGELVGCRLWGHTESDTTYQLNNSSSVPLYECARAEGHFACFCRFIFGCHK